MTSIFIIDDNPGDCRLIEVALQQGSSDEGNNCEVHTAGSLAEGIESLSKLEPAPNALLLDLNLPDASGLEGLRTLSLERHELPIIVLTGLSDRAVASEAIKLGASDYLEKDELEPRILWRAIRYAIDRKQHEIDLLKLASTDNLTGVRNRRSFIEHAEAALNQSLRTGVGCAVIAFDIDNFKDVNDVHGHATGDRLLVEIARQVSKCLRKTDTIGRLGGDEFAIVAPNLKSANHAIDIAEKIRRSISEIADLDGTKVNAGISVGIAVFDQEAGVTADTLISHADMAMYRSKARSNGAINYYDQDMDKEIKARHRVKRAILDDLGQDRFFAEYQPIVDAGTAEVVGAEALARWLGPDDKVVLPTQFIPIAEETGWIAPLGEEILEVICRQIGESIKAGGAMVPVSINVSPLQLRDANFAGAFVKRVEQLGVDPTLLKVEITESMIIGSMEAAARNIHGLRDAGIGIYVDDFGTGYCSLSILKDLPIDGVKIDRAFVARVPRDESAMIIIQAIAELSKKLSLKTIAEGVESHEQAERLSAIGIDYLQGFHFSRPRPFQTFEQLLLRQMSNRFHRTAGDANWHLNGRLQLAANEPGGEEDATHVAVR